MNQPAAALNPYLKPALIIAGAIIVAGVIIGHDLRPPRYQLISSDRRVFLFNTQTGSWMPYHEKGNSSLEYVQDEPVESVREQHR